MSNTNSNETGHTQPSVKLKHSITYQLILSAQSISQYVWHWRKTQFA